MAGEPKYGARLYKMDEGTLLVKQTVKSGGGHTDPYVVDEDREEYVDLNDDRAIARAVRRALNGELGGGSR